MTVRPGYSLIPLRLISESLALHYRENIDIWKVAYDNDDVRRSICSRTPVSDVDVRYDASKYPHLRKLVFHSWVQANLLTIDIHLTLI